MKSSSIFFFKLVILLSFSSSLLGQSDAHQVYFLPHSGNTLKLHKKKNLNLAIGLFKTSHYNNSSIVTKTFQIGYSPLKNIGVSIHHTRMKVTEKNNVSERYSNNHLTGLDLGGYHALKFPFKKQKKETPTDKIKYRRILFDLYTGYSAGQHKNYFYEKQNLITRVNGISKINEHKLYLQGGIHYLGKIVHLSFFLKRGQLFYPSGQIDNNVSAHSFEKIQTMLNKGSVAFLDFTYKVEFNFNEFGIFMEVTDEIKQEYFFPRTNIIGNFGIAINFKK